MGKKKAGGAGKGKRKKVPASAAASSAKRPRKETKNVAPSIKADIRPIMFGFGDVPDPFDESVDVLYAMVTNFVQSVTERALRWAAENKTSDEIKTSTTLSHKPFTSLVRRDQRLYKRIKELLHMHEELKRDRQVYPEAYEEGTKEIAST